MEEFAIERGNLESWTGNRLLRALARMLFNPSRTLSNVAQGHAPWFRVVRPLSAESRN